MAETQKIQKCSPAELYVRDIKKAQFVVELENIGNKLLETRFRDGADILALAWQEGWKNILEVWEARNETDPNIKFYIEFYEKVLEDLREQESTVRSG